MLSGLSGNQCPESLVIYLNIFAGTISACLMHALQAVQRQQGTTDTEKTLGTAVIEIC